MLLEGLRAELPNASAGSRLRKRLHLVQRRSDFRPVAQRISFSFLTFSWRLTSSPISFMTVQLDKPGESSRSGLHPKSIPLYLINGVATVWDPQSECRLAGSDRNLLLQLDELAPRVSLRTLMSLSRRHPSLHPLHLRSSYRYTPRCIPAERFPRSPPHPHARGDRLPRPLWRRLSRSCPHYTYRSISRGGEAAYAS